ncbi:MAG TPA: Rrf2 family transcriptional regulator [Bryobacteraceae bacterium]|nr:Rrf2 family transcriptional regulator [Bryobacteraceae bacterium]
MNLTLHSDYSLRILLYLAEHRDRQVSTREISDAYGISRNHLVRVVQTLDTHGFVKASAGRTGGVMLARDPAKINIGGVVRKTEPNFRIVECFDREQNTCRILAACSLRGVLHDALKSFFAVLDGYTLADLVRMKGSQRISDFLPVQAITRKSA